MISPTGLGIRSDADGDGHFGAPRGDRDHKGVDFLTEPGYPVVMPITFGQSQRLAWPYKQNGDYCGIEIKGYERGIGGVTVKIFYFVPFQINRVAKVEGDVIGWSQDISEKYGPPMLPHIHLEIRRNGKLLNPEDYLDRRFL